MLSTVVHKAYSQIRRRTLRMSGKVPDVALTVRDKRLTYLPEDALFDLSEQVKQLESQGIAGDIVETGCALGGSAILIAASKAKERRLRVFDVFGQIPPPSDRDGSDVINRYERIKGGKAKGIDGDEYYGYQENLIGTVTKSFEEFGYPLDTNNIELVQGVYEESLHLDQPVALAHIDCDWYDSVMTCLERIVPHLVQHGLLIIDDYYSWSGCRRAVDDFFRDKKAEYEFSGVSRLHIRKR